MGVRRGRKFGFCPHGNWD